MKRLMLCLLMIPAVALSGRLFVNGQSQGTIDGNAVIRSNGDIVVNLTEGTPDPTPEPTPTPTPTDCATVSGVTFTSFSSEQGHRGFNAPTGHKQKFAVGANKTLAFKFTAPPDGKAGYIATATDSHAPNGQHEIAISECPGDFSARLPQGVCKHSSASHTFWWSTFGKYFHSTCELNPGATYYMNLRYRNCAASQCGAKLSWSRFRG